MITKQEFKLAKESIETFYFVKIFQFCFGCLIGWGLAQLFI